MDQEPPGPVGRFVQAHRVASRRVELVVLGLLIVVLAAMLFYGFWRVLIGDVTHCNEKKYATVWPTGVALATVSIAGFVVGRLIGYLRKSRYGGPVDLRFWKDPAEPLVGLGLAVFLLFATFLLGYETFAVYQSGGDPPPITSYVRCAAADNPWVSAVAAFILGLLLGNWIWFPSTKRPWRTWRP